MFYALIRKELRLHRMVILVSLVVAAVTEVIVPALTYVLDTHRTSWPDSARQWQQIGQSIYSGSGIALVVTCLFAAVFGGGSATTERRERWGELVAMLPVAAVRRFVAATVVGIALTTTMFALHATILGSLSYSSWVFISSGTNRHLLTTGALSIGAFGLARLLSVWMRTPALLVTIVCGTLVSGLLLANEAEDSSRRTRRADAVFVDYTEEYLRATAIVGVIALLASFPIAARRAEP